MKFLLLSLTIFLSASAFGQNTFPNPGNVGIGTTTPQNALSVLGSASFGGVDNGYTGPSQYGAINFPKGQLLFSNTNAQGQLYLLSGGAFNSTGDFRYLNVNAAAGIGIDNGSIALLTAPAGTIGAPVNFLNRLIVTNSGNIGIATSTPVAADALAKTIQIGSQMILQNVVGNQVSLSNNAYYNGTGWYTVNADKASALRMYQGGFDIFTVGTTNPGIDASTAWTSKFSVTNVGNVGIGTTGPTRRLSIEDISTNSYMSYNNAGSEKWVVGNEGVANNRFVIYGGSTPNYKLTILNNGNLGIGTNTPQAALDVNGVIQISGQNTSMPPPDLSYGLFGYGGIGLGIFSSAILPDQGIGIWTNPAGVPKEVMRIQSTGYVGIGTLAPDQRLTVKGTIHSSEVKVDLNIPGPDYVFKKNYNLPGLSEVNNYINKNHHLSEIPSARQMEKNGINLGDLNMKLLKKVEELTLYVIDQQKQIDVLKKQINKRHK